MPQNPSALPPFLFNPLGVEVEVGVAGAVAVGGAVGGGVGVAVGRGTSGRPYRFSTPCGKPLNNAGGFGGPGVVDLWGAAVHHSLRVQWQVARFASVDARQIGCHSSDGQASRTSRAGRDKVTVNPFLGPARRSHAPGSSACKT